MPLLENSDYKRPSFLFNAHLETILPNIVKKANDITYQREIFYTKDNDFINLDWLRQASNQLIILAHGLEGNSNKAYIKGLASWFYNNGWDVLAWNCRSCGGAMNWQKKLYHHGDTEDLAEIVDHLVEEKKYHAISMAGVSMGGSIILKYLGQMGDRLAHTLKSAVAISVPCDLSASERVLRLPSNALYRIRFYKKLWRKIYVKAQQFLPEAIEKLKQATSFEDLHHAFTLPVYGYKSVKEFYQQGSANNFLTNIKIPILIINAANDPLLSKECFPIESVQHHDHLYLEIPKYGGHAGFSDPFSSQSWLEARVMQFIQAFN